MKNPVNPVNPVKIIGLAALATSLTGLFTHPLSIFLSRFLLFAFRRIPFEI